MKKALGVLLIFLALCCAIILSAKRVPKEELTTTTESTTESATEELTEPTTEDTTTTEKRTTARYVPSPRVYDENEYIAPEYFRKMGIISDGEYKYTWYSENVLPGGALTIPGRHSDGDYVRDQDDYIVLASSELPKGTVLETPFGTGKIYDAGCPKGVVDVYVSW